MAGSLDNRPSGMIENNGGTLVVQDTIFENNANAAIPPSNVRGSSLGCRCQSLNKYVRSSLTTFCVCAVLVVTTAQTKVAYIILNQVGTLELTGNCFVENDVTVAPVINQLGGSIQLSAHNFAERIDPTVICVFIANVDGSSFIGDGVTPIENISVSCVDHDLDSCIF